MNHFFLKTNRSIFVVMAASALVPMLLGGLAFSQETAAEKVTFDDHVLPILTQRCSSCHNAQKREGDLDVTNYTNLMQGGGSGAVIESQDASGSYLFQLITHEDSPEMPPSGTKIPDPEIQMIAKWIDMGALENSGSKAAKAKPKFEMALADAPTTRPDSAPIPLRIPLEPVIKTAKPSVIAIATSPWAPLAAVAAPKQVLLYNTQTLQLVGVLPMEEGLAHTLHFSRNGQLLLAGGGRDGASGTTILWNVITGERVTTVGQELESVLAADISPNHEFIALGGPSKLVKIFSTSDGSLIAEIKKHTDWVTAIEFSPDGKYLATGDRNGGLHIWEPDTGSEVYVLKGHSKAITEISWRADSQIVASGSEDTTLRIWELKNGKQVKSWGAHGGGVTSIEFLRDGQIVSCGRDKVAKIWDQAGKMIRQFPGLPDVAVAVSFCDESKRVFAGDWTGQIVAWNAADGTPVGHLIANPPKLAERLVVAEQVLAATQQKHTPLVASVTQTKTKLDASGAALVAAKSSQVQLQTQLAATEKQLSVTQQALTATNAQHAQLQKELAEKNLAKPLVKDSFVKATAALAALPADEELKSMVASLDAKFKQLDARITELDALSVKAVQVITASQSQMDVLGKTLVASKSEMGAIVVQVAKHQTDVGAMTEKLKTDAQAAESAQAEVQNATTQVARWKSDIAFIAQLKTLDDQLRSSEQAAIQKQAAVDQAQQTFLEAKQGVDQATQEQSSVKQQVDGLRAQILKLRGG